MTPWLASSADIHAWFSTSRQFGGNLLFHYKPDCLFLETERIKIPRYILCYPVPRSNPESLSGCFSARCSVHQRQEASRWLTDFSLVLWLLLHLLIQPLCLYVWWGWDFLGQPPTDCIKNNQSYLTVLTFWLFQLLRQPDLMKCSLINLMFSNCLSWFWSWREKKKKKPAVKTVNPKQSIQSWISPWHQRPLCLLSLFSPPSPPPLLRSIPPSFFLPVMLMNRREERYFRFTKAYIFLKGFPLLCSDFFFSKWS